MSSVSPARSAKLNAAALGEAIATAVGSGIAVVDTQGRSIYVNDAFCQMVGWPREELVGTEPPFCYWPEDAQEAIEDAFRRTLAGDAPRRGWELTFQRRSSERFPALLFIAPLLHEGVGQGWVANIVDISTQVAQAEALERSEERLQAAQDGAGIGVWDWDLRSGEVYWSAEVARLYGVPQTTLVDYQSWRRCVPVGHLARVDAVVAAAVERHEPFEVEFPVELDSGAMRWLLSRGKAQYDATGQPVRILGVNLDITDRRRTDEALAEAKAREARFESERRLVAVLGQSFVGIAEAALDGRLLAVNARMSDLTGYSHEELLQRKVQDLVPADDVPALVVAMEALRRGGELPPIGERRYLRKDGTVTWVAVAVTVLRNDLGRPERLHAVVLDIAPRKAQEEALREAERRWQFALEGSAQGVWDWDLPSHEVYYSPRYKAMLGYGPDEISDSEEEWSSRLHPDDRGPTLATVEQHFRGEIPVYDLQFRMRRKDGSYAWIESRGLIVERTDDGRPKRVIGTHTDITERKAAADALAHIVEQLRLASDGAKIGLWYWPLPGDVLIWSDYHKTMFGLPPDREPSWDYFRSVVHPDDWERVDLLGREALEQRSDFKQDYRIILPDGEVRWIAASGRCYANADGSLRGVGGVVQDFTARKLAAAELERTRLMMAEGERIARLGSWEYVAATGELVWSEGECRIFGVDLAQKSTDYRLMLRERIHPDDAAVLDASFRRALEHQAAFELEHRIVQPDGNVRWVRNRGTPAFDHAGQLVKYVGSTLDITEQRSAEQALRDLTRTLEVRVAERTAQLEVASAAKSVFLANMSHEIRTPLNAILGTAQLLEQKAVDAEDRDSARRIRDAGDILLRNLNDILDLSKIEAGQLGIERRPFCIAELIATVESIAATMARGKGLALRIDAGATRDLMLSGDAVRVQQVLLNLLSNAVKFTATGEVVLWIAVQESSANAVRLRFEVRDTGIGISASQVTPLFAPFTQADSGIARRFGGTGLGLAISKRLVELMGGVIGVDSAEGIGSTFWFELPFNVATKPEAAQPGVSPAARSGAGAGNAQLQGLRVLVVDDSRMNLDVVERLLKRDGAEVTLTDSGRSALDILQAQPQGFDVVLMDIQMPGMDGLAATRQIRQDPVLGRMPVIALTAGVMPEERAAASDAGVDDLLPKPVDLKQMRTMLARYLVAGG